MDQELREEMLVRREVRQSLRTVRRRLVLEVKSGVRSVGEANREFTMQLIEAEWRLDDPFMRPIAEWEADAKVGVSVRHRAGLRSNVDVAHRLEMAELVANGREVRVGQLMEWQAAQMEAESTVERELKRRGPRSAALLPEQLAQVARGLGW